MRDQDTINHADLDDLFEKYRQAPSSYVFVPLADACRKLSRLEEALEICRAGLEYHPRYASGRVVLGKCLYDAGNAEAAREAFQRVLDIDRDNLVALKYLGRIEADRDNFEGARDYFRHILALDPENKEIGGVLRSVEERELAEVARHEVDAAVAVTPVEVEPDDEADGEESAFEAQAIELGSDIDIETSDELASITLADIFRSQGYVDRARKIYQEVLRKQPNNQMVRRKLLDLEGAEAAPPPADEYDAPAPPAEVAPESTAVSDGDEAIEITVTEAVDEVVEESGFQELGEDESVDATPTRTVTRTRRRSPRAQEPARRELESESMQHFRRWLNRLSD